MLLALCFVHTLSCHADWFKGKVVSAETGEPLVGASIFSEVNPQPGWSMQNNAEADSTGCFVIGNGWEGRILFTFSMIGYKNFRKVDYSYGEDVKDTIDLGTIKLQPTALMLREVEVTAKIPRITMSGDTIVFNPEAFKLKDGARLDELIKKLPGVQNRDGKLYWNDKPIRLMMNGKDLFGGDQIINELPAEVAQKLKLYDRKSELSRHTGKDDGEEDHVLDIQVKPGFLDKWYGEAKAQYQTNDRYMFDLTASKLSDHDPQVVYAQANSINRYIDRTMTSSSNSNIDGDGRSQYGSYNYQHNWVTKGAEKFSNNHVDLGASFGHYDGWLNSSSSKETFFPNQDRTFSLSKTYRYKHKLWPKLQANLFAYTDSVNVIRVDARASYGKTHGLSKQDGASYSYSPDQFQYYSLAEAMGAKPGDALYEHLVTRNRNYNTSDEQNRSLNLNYTWSRFCGKKGSFALQGRTQVSGDNNQTHTRRQLEYIRDGRNETQLQFFDYSTHNFAQSLSAMIEYWVSKKVYVKASDKVSYNRYHSNRAFFADTDQSGAEGLTATTLDADNCFNSTNRTWTNEFTLKSTITPVKDLMIMPNLDWTVTREDADYQYGRLDTATVRTTHAYTPSIFMKWKISRVRNMDFSFSYNTTVPELSQTFAFRNTVDPLSISTGNAHLGNTHSHTTALGYHRMWLRQQIVLGLRAEYTKNINPLATLFRYNSQTGVYESKPMNVKGGDQWTVNFDYDQGLGVDYRLMNKISLTNSTAYGYLTLVDAASNAVPELNKQKRFGLNENFVLAYEVEKVRLALSDQLAWSRYRYNNGSYNSNPLFNVVGIDATLSLAPFEFNVGVNDEYRSGYQTQSMNGHRLISSAYVSFRFLKNKARLMLRADDIFNKDIWYNNDYTAFQRSESASDYIHHYLNLTFSYKFDAKASKGKAQDRRGANVQMGR